VAKPFSIQSPEDIAKEYAGNKQKIAQAMQLGVVDPTAGVLAGMFIDRMRSAQMQERAPQMTVAQQVMGGAQPAPPAAPSGGLGATPQAMPQAAPPMAPEMAAPAPEAPMGMAEGGIVGLDIPDTMYDEPSNGGFNDGYAGGGLVAFADGGGVDLNDFRRAIIAQESGGRFGVANTEGSGAMGLGQIMPDTARALAKRLGLPYRPDLLAGKSKEAQQYQIALTNEATREAFDYGKGDVNKAAAYYFAGPDQSKWGDKTKKYQSDIAERLGVALPERDVQTAEGQLATTEDIFKRLQERFGQSAEEKAARAKLRARAEEMASDEEYEKNRKGDMWQTLAEIGFNMASSKSPYLLQAIGEAAAAAMPGARADKKERKAIKDKGLDLMVELGAADRKEAQQLWGIAVDAAKTNLSQKELAQRMALADREITSRENIAALDRDLQREVLLAKANDKTTFERQVAAYMAANPGLSEVQIYKLMRADGLIGNQNAAGGDFFGEQGGGAQQGGGDMAIVGSRPAQ